MFKNYVKVALRNLNKQKLYAGINIFSLAIGLAICSLIALYVRYELSYDRFHEHGDRVYRVYQTELNPDGSVSHTYPHQALPLGPAMKADLPEVEAYVRFTREELFVKTDSTAFEEEILFSDAAIFEVFSFPLVQGEAETALVQPNSVVLSEAMARKYFGEAEALGQSLQINLDGQFEVFTVAGVARDMPGPSSIDFDILTPLLNNSFARRADGQWGWNGFPTYIKLTEAASAEALQGKLEAFRASYFPDELARLQEDGWEGDHPGSRFFIQPLAEVHFSPTITAGIATPTNPVSLYILSGIALAILLLACINFMTLAIGRSARRAREVGIRKTLGAQRTQLMRQFWSEAFMLSGVALVFALMLAELGLPIFSELVGIDFRFESVYTIGMVGVIVGLTLLTGLLAGSYPSVVLSRAVPIEALKNKQKLGGANLMTQSLVTVQFAVSVFLIITTFIMLDQLQYVNTKDLGFDKEQVVVVPMQGLNGDRTLGRFEQALGVRPDVVGVTGMSNSFGQGHWFSGFRYKGEDKSVLRSGVAASFVDVMEVELVAGRSFAPHLTSDSTHALLINEAMARDFGWTEPVGQVVSGFYGDDPARDPVVIGVMKDFNYRSLHSPVEPMAVTLGRLSSLLIRIRPDDIPTTLAALEATWTQIAPELPFTYRFLDDDLNHAYRAEQRWSQIVGYASSLAILVACLGLFGLAALTVTGRTKEIGIRKVLGATVTNVAVLVSRDFVRLVVLGIVLGAPIAYWVMHRWLEHFAYRISIGPGVFIAAALGVVAVALLTVSYQAISIAFSNPVTSLRQE